MSDSTTFYCEVCGEDFYTYDSCVYDGLIIKCKCGVKFKIALVKIEEKDTSASVMGGFREQKEYKWT